MHNPSYSNFNVINIWLCQTCDLVSIIYVELFWWVSWDMISLVIQLWWTRFWMLTCKLLSILCPLGAISCIVRGRVTCDVCVWLLKHLLAWEYCVIFLGLSTYSFPFFLDHGFAIIIIIIFSLVKWDEKPL